MTRELIQQIFDRVKNQLPEIKKVNLFNDDFEKQNEGVKSTLKFPALFVSFPEGCTYIQNGSGVQRSDDFIVRFHIGLKFYDEKSVLEIFDLKEKIFGIFQGWQPQNASSFNRQSETPDEFRGNHYVFIQDYLVNIIDSTNFIENKRIPVTLSPKIQGELRIDERTKGNVRTDKQ